MGTHKSKTEIDTISKETYMEAAKEVLVKAFNLIISPAKYSVNFMTLERSCKRIKLGVEVTFIWNNFIIDFRSKNFPLS
jgi:hypothetical protein